MGWNFKYYSNFKLRFSYQESISFNEDLQNICEICGTKTL